MQPAGRQLVALGLIGAHILASGQFHQIDAADQDRRRATDPPITGICVGLPRLSGSPRNPDRESRARRARAPAHDRSRDNPPTTAPRSRSPLTPARACHGPRRVTLATFCYFVVDGGSRVVRFGCGTSLWRRRVSMGSAGLSGRFPKWRFEGLQVSDRKPSIRGSSCSQVCLPGLSALGLRTSSVRLAL